MAKTTQSRNVTKSKTTGSAKLTSVTPQDGKHRWTFLTNHSHVLILLYAHPDLVLREVAARVGITERAVQQMILDLEEAGVIDRKRVGRQNHYRVKTHKSLRHPIESHCKIADLLRFVIEHPLAKDSLLS